MTAFATRLATVFGVGNLPLAPGTWASLVALPFGWGFVHFDWQTLSVASLLCTLIGIWACGVHARKTGVKDPSECVIDEVAGQWIALIPIAVRMAEFDWRPFAMAFFLFRLFDMTKPWPVSAAEGLPGGLGIMMDDVVAGAMAAAILYGMMYIHLIA